ncbi:MAG: acyl-CoA thioesterase [Bacteroidia bacterium]|nr:acyl-CoA thioesterase [Bacteroidia bacterium]
MEPKDFKHKLQIQIRYKDVDIQGHVNNANHITYFETARVKYFNDLLIKNDWNKTGMILAKTEIDYSEPVYMDDECFCYTKITSFGTKSFEISNLITKKVGKEELVCAHGKSVIVCFNYEIKQTVEIPSAWKEAVAAYEK